MTVTRTGSITTGNGSAITINGNGILNITSDLTINLNNVEISIGNGGELNVGGNFIAQNNAVFNITSNGTFHVDGNFDLKQNVEMTLDGGLEIDGTFSVDDWDKLEGTGDLTIGGTYCGQIDCAVDCSATAPTGNNLTCDDFNGSGILPVKFIHFSNTINNSITQLSWSTAEEINNSHFVIEESFDGKNFTDKGIVSGVGNSVIVQNYFFSLLTQNETTYYRLKQVDINGQFDYSKVLVQTHQLGEFEIYPNPSSQNVNCTLTPYEGNTIIEITNEFGLVISDDIYNTSITNEVNFSIITKGIYFVKVIQGNKMNVKKLIIH